MSPLTWTTADLRGLPKKELERRKVELRRARAKVDALVEFIDQELANRENRTPKPKPCWKPCAEAYRVIKRRDEYKNVKLTLREAHAVAIREGMKDIPHRFHTFRTYCYRFWGWDTLNGTNL